MSGLEGNPADGRSTRWIGTGVGLSYYADRYGGYPIAECVPPVHCPSKVAPTGKRLSSRASPEPSDARVRRLIDRDVRPVAPYDPPRRMGEDQAPRLLAEARSVSRELELLLTEHILRRRKADPTYAMAFDGADVRTELHDALLESWILSDQLETEIAWSTAKFARQAPLEWMQAGAILPQMRMSMREVLLAWMRTLDAVSVAMVRDR